MSNTHYIETQDGGLYCSKTGLVAELVTKAEDSTGPIVLLVSTEAVDSDGDVIHQRRNKNGPGWELDRFNKAPVISWQHDLRIPNLSGPGTKAKVQRHPTKGQGLYLDPLVFDEGDMFAMSIEGKIRRSVLKESSVGFRVLSRDTRKDEGGRVTGFDIWGASLYEVAIANRGANPETEVMAKRLLMRKDARDEVETGGSAEAGELLAELDHLKDELGILSNAVKMLSDTVDAQEQAKILAAEDKTKTILAAREKAAAELLAVCTAAGTAHT